MLLSVAGDYERTSRLASWRSTVESLGAVLCGRFSSAARLRAELEEWAVCGDPPWPAWAAKNPLLATAIRELGVEEEGHEPATHFAALSIEQLLAIDDPYWARDVGEHLERRTSEEDVRLLIAAAGDESFPMRGPAIVALAAQQRPEALEIASELREKTRPRWLRIYMTRALVRLPYEQTRSLAYRWLDSEDTRRRSTAASVLKEHATAGDIPTIRDHLRREGLDRETSNMYFVCELVTALERHPDQGPYEELHAVFYEIPYSYGRRRVAAALAATDPAFPQTQAVECLWDCEPEVRAIGAGHVDSRDRQVLKRLNVMASDWAENEHTQLAAQERLGDR